jgi:cytochrome c-type biogenesis protein
MAQESENPPMMLQVLPEVVFEHIVAFVSGVYVAVSPCLFPLLPLFLIRSLQSEDSRRKSVLVTVVLVIGVVLSLAAFVAISYFVSVYFIIQHRTQIQAILGCVIIFAGVLTMSHTLREKLRLTKLSMHDPGTPTNLAGVFIVGFSYALLAAPCTLPVIIVAIPALFGAGAIVSSMLVVSLFIWLSIGVALPYLAIALVTGEARDRMASRISNSARIIEILVGVLLIVLGLYLIKDWFISLVLA